MKKILSIILILIGLGSQSFAAKGWLVSDKLQGKLYFNNALLLGMGMTNPLLGGYANWIMPDLGGTYVEVGAKFSMDFFDEPMPLLGDGGFMGRVTYGWRTDSKVTTDSFMYTTSSWSDYNYIYRRGYEIWGPVRHDSYFVIETWLEPNGVYGKEKSGTYGGQTVDYKKYEAGSNLIIVPKWMWAESYDFEYHVEDYGTRRFHGYSSFAIGPMLSPNLSHWGLWIDAMMMYDSFFFDVGIGFAGRTDVPEYYATEDDNGADDIQESSGLEGLYMPYDIMLGWKIDL